MEDLHGCRVASCRMLSHLARGPLRLRSQDIETKREHANTNCLANIPAMPMLNAYLRESFIINKLLRHDKACSKLSLCFNHSCTMP